MKKLITTWVAKVLMLVIFSATIFSCGGHSDEEIMKDITEKLQQGYGNVNATVEDGVVTLTGTCEGDTCAAAVEKEVAEINGVKSVTNKIQSQAQTDLTLRTSVQSIISKYQGVQADVAAGNIVLRGTINRDQVQPLMNELEALQPKQIDNQLAVE